MTALVVSADLFVVERLRRNVSNCHATVAGKSVLQDVFDLKPGETKTVVTADVAADGDQLLYVASSVPITATFGSVTTRPSRLIVLPLVPASISFTLQADSLKSASVFCARSFN